MWSSSSWGGELPTSFNDVDTTPKSRCTSAASARRASGDIIPLRICPHRGCGFPRATDTRQSAGGGCGPLPKEEEYDRTGHKKNPQDIDLADSAHLNRGARRRERDSNPRYSCPYTAFRVRPDRPLRHLSNGCLCPHEALSIVWDCKYINFFAKKRIPGKIVRFFLHFPPGGISEGEPSSRQASCADVQSPRRSRIRSASRTLSRIQR